ncbi:MAG: hypothetical protein IH949_01355 [Bacteroidetes bacterium]|nr:hypothetical protein [Bacteroidota bacterium]
MEESNLTPFIRQKLDILFVGLNPAFGSSRNKHYFSVFQSFWSQLFESGLITSNVDKSNADEIIFGSTQKNFNNWSFGITDLVTEVAENKSSKIKPTRTHVRRLLDTIKENEPIVVILLHGKVLDKVLSFLGYDTPDANSGELGKILKDYESNFFNMAFPHGNTITSVDKVKRYFEVKDYLINKKSTNSN